MTIGKCKSFSLLETLIAIAILSVGLLAVFGLITYTLSISRTSPEEVIAVNLAQEGIEIVRNIRDSNWVVGNLWYAGITISGNQLRGTVDYNSYEINELGNPSWNSVDDCVAEGEDCRLYKDGNGVYSHDSAGVATQFYRLVLTDKDPSNNRLIVASQVGWSDRSGHHTVILEEHLYDYNLPENSPLRYHWECCLTADCSVHSVSSSDCRIGRDFEDVAPGPPCNSAQKAPCDWNIWSRNCYNYIVGETAFGGDPDCVWDGYDDDSMWNFQQLYDTFIKVQD